MKDRLISKASLGRTRPSHREGRLPGVNQLQRQRDSLGAGHSEVEPLKVAGIVVFTEWVWSDLQLNIRWVSGAFADNIAAVKGAVHA